MGYRYKKRRRRYRLKPVPITIALLLVIAIIVGLVYFIKGAFKPDKDTSSVPPSSQASDAPVGGNVDTPSAAATGGSSDGGLAAPTAAAKADWELVLLNRSNAIDEDFSIKKTKFDTEYIDARIATAYQMMCDAAKVEGITLYLRSGYRSISTQKANYEADIKRNEGNGSDKEEAKILTEKYYALPGQSEHHTGLALDIITPEYHKSPRVLDERFADTDAYKWLVKNCTTYGFILRYPENKANITNINFEPWHYRYVGVENAQYMTEKGICLEEYVATLN